MFDELHIYYERELEFLQRAAGEFAEKHPKIAARLRLSSESADPHVERLLQGCAFVSARIQRRLDDDFPELTQGLLEVLYPHYLAPIPSMAIVQFAPVADLSGPAVIPSGTAIDVGPVAGDNCRYRTGYEVSAWPLAIEAASLAPRPIIAPANPNAAGSASVLRIKLACMARDTPISALAPDRLRFFIQPQSPQANRLYELILNHTISVAFAESPADPDPVIVASDAVVPVGFAEDEWLLPYPTRSFVGYRLLTEFFAFPEKFMFFDVTGLAAKTRSSMQPHVELFFYLDRSNVELERSVSRTSFALGCTPIVNLFPLRAEPILLDHRAAEYRVVADARRPDWAEVYAIHSVTASAPDGAAREYAPFFGLPRFADTDRNRYWHASRRDAAIGGTELFLSFVDFDFDPDAPANHTVSIEALCLNRDIPADLPFGGGYPRLEVEGASSIASIACLTKPTPTIRPPLGRGTRWRLVSHLVLNHLSISGDDDGAAVLRAILDLYDFRDAAHTKALIASIRRVNSRPGIARMTSAGVTAFCRGVDVDIEFEPGIFDNGQGFLFATILDRFLALYTTVNSFTRTTARLRGAPEAVRTWPARTGFRPLV